MSFETFAEAVVTLKKTDKTMFAMDPRTLGEEIHIVTAPVYGCPYCRTAPTRMAVHEYGVRWPCGCARMLAPLHRSVEERARCKKCCPDEYSNIVPIRRSA